MQKMGKPKKPKTAAEIMDAAQIAVTLRQRGPLDTAELGHALGIADILSLEEFMQANAGAGIGGWALDIQDRWQVRRDSPGQSMLPGTELPVDDRVAPQAMAYRDALEYWQSAAQVMKDAKSDLERVMADHGVKDVRVSLGDGSTLHVWIEVTETKTLKTKVEKPKKSADDSE